MTSYLRRFKKYAPEIFQAVALMEDVDFKRELAKSEVTDAAFTVCDAFSEFWAAWHGGQSSHLYSIGSGFSKAFDYDHRASEVDEPGSQVREFYACLCVVFAVDDPIRWEIFGEPKTTPEKSP